MSNNEYFFDDVIVVFGMQLFMLNLGPAKHLSSRRPTDSLFHPQVIVSILGQIAVFLTFFSLVIWIMYGSDWFCSLEEATVGLDQLTFQPLPDADPNTLYPCYPIDANSYHTTRWNWLFTSYENSVAWLFGHTQFYVSAWAFTVVSRFRAPIWTDPVYCVYLALALLMLLLLLLTPPEAVALSQFFYNLFGVLPGIPFSFRLFMTVTFLLDWIACVFLWEWLVVDVLVGRLVEKWNARQAHRRDLKEMHQAEVAEERASISIVDSKRSADWSALNMEMEMVISKGGLKNEYWPLGDGKGDGKDEFKGRSWAFIGAGLGHGNQAKEQANGTDGHGSGNGEESTIPILEMSDVDSDSGF
jgi:hypothetical protein